MNIPVSRTKIVVPKWRQELLTRPRLIKLLFEYLDKKLILISAPAGYGKTSLLIDLSRHSELPICWLSLDSLDQNPQRFTAYFIRALEEQFPEFGKQTRAILNTLTTLEEGLESLVVTLVNEVYDRIPQHFILILDDYHLINNNPVVQSFLSRFIPLVDENCHLIISSRTLTQLPDLPLLVAKDMVAGLDLGELAFRTEEIQQLFGQNYGIHISDDTAKKLLTETEGWITGLKFSSLGITPGLADKLTGARAAGINLFDYLGQQVLDQQPEDVRFFLLRSSLLEEFNASLCEAVFGELYPLRKEWSRWIEFSVNNNLFALPVGLESGWIRYHHLFRDFLQNRLQQDHPEEIQPILGNLAHTYELLNEWDKAYHIRKQLDDVNALAGLIERAAPNLMSHALLTLDTWLKELPPSIRKTRPGLVSIQGIIAYMKGDLHEGLFLLNQAEADLRSNDDTLGLALTLVRRAAAHRFLGDYQSGLQDADEVIRLTEYSDDLQLLFADALREKGLNLFRLGEALNSAKNLERALEIFKLQEDTSHIPILMMETGMVYGVIGKEDIVEQLYSQALQLWKQEGNFQWQANLLNNLGVHHFLHGDYDKAILVLEEGLICAKRSPFSVRVEALILISLGDVYAEVEDFSLADQYYQRGYDIAQVINDRFLLNYLKFACANLAIQESNFEKAYREVDELRKLISSQSSQYENGLFHLVKGQLSLMQENVPNAIKELLKAENCFSLGEHVIECAKSKIWLAASYLQNKDASAARQKINELINSETRNKYPIVVFIRQTQAWLEALKNDLAVGNALHDLLNRAIKVDQEFPEIRRRVRRLAQRVEIPDAKLTIQAFGRPQVRVGIKTLTLSDWQTQSVHDLFFYFLTREQPMTKETIGLAFWPDIEDPARLKVRFKNDLYRLRRAVGKDIILYDNELYSFNHTSDYEYDLEAFNGYLYQAELVQDESKKIELLQSAVDLVNGHFLEGVDAAWVIPRREQVNRQIISVFLTLGNLLKNNHLVNEAIEVYQRAIHHDHTNEESYLMTLKMYNQLNDRVNALRLYENYVEMMNDELDLPPSPEMEAVYKNLLH